MSFQLKSEKISLKALLMKTCTKARLERVRNGAIEAEDGNERYGRFECYILIMYRARELIPVPILAQQLSLRPLDELT